MMIPPHLIAEALTHIIAFLLLFVVLKAFAWKPILRVLDERARVVRERLDGALAQKQRAKALRREYEERLDQIDEEARRRLNETLEEGRRMAEEMMEKARTEAEEIRAKARLTAQAEVDQARVALRDRIVAMTLDATERLIHEKLDDAKHHELVERFVEKVESRKS